MLAASGISLASGYRSKKRWGTDHGRCGLCRPTARKKGCWDSPSVRLLALSSPLRRSVAILRASEVSVLAWVGSENDERSYFTFFTSPRLSSASLLLTAHQAMGAHRSLSSSG